MTALVLLLLLVMTTTTTVVFAETVAPSPELHCWAHTGVYCSPNLVVASFEDDAVSVYRQTAPGLFSSQKEVVASSVGQAIAIATADMNGDGHEDVVALSFSDGSASWYDVQHNNAQWPIGVAAPGDASALAVGDMDGDGLPDVVMAGPGAGTLVWYKNNANGNFHNASVVHNGTFLGDDGQLLVTDLDGDGRVDVVSVSGSGGIRLHRRLADGSFAASAHVISTRGHRVALADLTGDSLLDVLSAPEDALSDELSWFANQGGGSFGPEQVISTSMTRPSHVQLASSTGDLVVGSPFGVFFLQHQSAAIFGPPMRIADAQTTRGVLFADLDLRGEPDVAFVSSADDVVGVILSNARGQFKSAALVSDESDAPRALAVLFEKTACPKGFRCDSTSHAPRACPVGYSSESGASACTMCRPGTFAALPASPACLPCQAFSYTAHNASWACVPCPPGRTPSSAATSCVDCPADYVCDGSGLGPRKCDQTSWLKPNDAASACVDRCWCNGGVFWILAAVSTIVSGVALIPSRPTEVFAVVLLSARHVKMLVDWAYVLLHVYASSGLQAFWLVLFVAHVIFNVVQRVLVQPVFASKLGIPLDPAKTWHAAVVCELFGFTCLHMVLQIVNNAQTRWEGVGAASFVLFFVVMAMHWRTYVYVYMFKRVPLAKLPFSPDADSDEEEVQRFAAQSAYTELR